MATIDTLNKSVSDMTEEELLERIRQVRARRRSKPEKPVRQKSTAAAKPKSEPSFEQLFAAMSAEEQAKILAKLGGTS